MFHSTGCTCQPRNRGRAETILSLGTGKLKGKAEHAISEARTPLLFLDGSHRHPDTQGPTDARRATPPRADGTAGGLPRPARAVRSRPAARASVSPFVNTGSQGERGSCAAPAPSPVFPGGPGGAARRPPPLGSPLGKARGVGKPRARGSRADVSGLGVPRAGPARGRAANRPRRGPDGHGHGRRRPGAGEGRPRGPGCPPLAGSPAPSLTHLGQRGGALPSPGSPGSRTGPDAQHPPPQYLPPTPGPRAAEPATWARPHLPRLRSTGGGGSERGRRTQPPR